MKKINLAEAYAEEVQEEDRELRKLKTIEKMYGEALDCVDRVFQDKDCILPGFARAGDDKFEKVVDLAREYVKMKEKLDKVRDVLDD